MGNDTSKAAAEAAAAEQSDLNYLSDRFPFDDAELARLYQYYQGFEHRQRKPSRLIDNAETTAETSTSSFLLAWAQHGSAHSTTLLTAAADNDSGAYKDEVMRAEFTRRLHIVEQDILPPHFDEQLEQVAFLRPADRGKAAAEYSVDKDKNNNMDEFTRKERMEAFFEGLANCGGRRGSRAALGTLFQLCVSPVEQDGNNNKQQHPTNSKNLVDATGNEIKAKVLDVLDLAYRLAVAIECLRVKHSDDDDEEEESKKNIPPPIDSAQTTKALEPLATSCLDYVHQQRARRSVVVETMDDSDLEQGYCSKMDFLEWSEATAPLLSSILPTFQHSILFPHQPYPPSMTAPFSFPRLNDESVILNVVRNKDTSRSHICTATTPTLFSLVCMSKSLVGHWHRLYTSNADGMSFNRLHNALLGYSGPTLLVIQSAAAATTHNDDDDDDDNNRSSSGAVFGAFTGSGNTWKDSNEYYGNTTVFLYSLSPEPTVFRPSGGRDTNFMYCNSKSSRSGIINTNNKSSLCRDGGIAFGGDLPTRSPRLFLDESFSGCYVSSHDTTFAPGHLLPRTDEFSQKTYFNMDQLEVWGCSGEDDTVAAKALEEREQDRAVREANIRNARTVLDKTAFLGDLRTGLIESKAFTHVDQIHGSTRFHVLNRNKKGHY